VLRNGAEPLTHGSGHLRKGEIVEIVTPGAGGYGPPAERDPAVVHRDVAEGRIDRDTADIIYGLAP
jgi:N-methylhydantoinase B